MKRRKFFGSIVTLLLFFCGITGCSAQKPITAASVHQTITTAIADAGTVAILAEQQYQAGTIPQTATNRTLINDLGNAYNKAKDVFQDVLSAEAAARSTTQMQINACTPAAANSAACDQATKNAQVATANAAAAQTTLTNTVNALVTQTSSVKAITKP
jgi:hypothetical protein